MSTLTAPREVNAYDSNVGNEILRQLGGLIRGCLDMKGSKCFIIRNGVLARGVIINNKNNRGDITIVLNEWDLYDLTIRQTRRVKGVPTSTTLHEFSGLQGLDVVQLRNFLNELWR